MRDTAVTLGLLLGLSLTTLVLADKPKGIGAPLVDNPKDVPKGIGAPLVTKTQDVSKVIGAPVEDNTIIIHEDKGASSDDKSLHIKEIPEFKGQDPHNPHLGKKDDIVHTVSSVPGEDKPKVPINVVTAKPERELNKQNKRKKNWKKSGRRKFRKNLAKAAAKTKQTPSKSNERFSRLQSLNRFGRRWKTRPAKRGSKAKLPKKRRGRNWKKASRKRLMQYLTRAQRKKNQTPGSAPEQTLNKKKQGKFQPRKGFPKWRKLNRRKIPNKLAREGKKQTRNLTRKGQTKPKKVKWNRLRQKIRQAVAQKANKNKRKLQRLRNMARRTNKWNILRKFRGRIRATIKKAQKNKKKRPGNAKDRKTNYLDQKGSQGKVNRKGTQNKLPVEIKGKELKNEAHGDVKTTAA